MKTRMMWMTVVVATALVLMAGVAGALPGRLGPEAVVAEKINYQGRLTDAGGTPLDGTYPMRFQLYDAETSGTMLWDSGIINVGVNEGLFSVDLSVDHYDFDGQALWLRIYVDGDWLTPRQELVPVPYALNLRPGAEMVGDTSTGATLTVRNDNSAATGSAVWGTSATGTAIYGRSTDGNGLYGYSQSAYAVAGYSMDSWGGYFSSSEGYGLRAITNGTNHWDHGGYFSANMGYGVYAESAQNYGLVATGGTAGVRGNGDFEGVFGSSNTGAGVYGSSSDYGVQGSTWSADGNYGLHTYDNLYSLNFHTAGATMQVAQNGGDEPLEPGDVVVFAGMAAPLAEGGPSLVQVARASSANSSAVAGVVLSRFNAETLIEDRSPDGRRSRAGLEVTLEGPVPSGEHLLLVVQGPTQAKVSALSGAIQTGDLLSTTGEAGYATRAAEVTIEGVSMAIPGTVFGKALEPLDADQGLIYVFVTLQ